MLFSSFKADSQCPTATNASVNHQYPTERRGPVRGIAGEQRDCFAHCEEGSRAQPGLQEVKATDAKAEEAAYEGEDGQGCCESGTSQCELR